MKILLLYATRGGATRTCAEILAKRLSAHHTVDLIAADEETIPAPNGYQAVAVGSFIRMGKIHRRIKQYLRTYEATLSAMPTAVFFCCGYPKQFEEYTETQLSRKLVCSLGVHCFGGELKPEKLHGFDKLAVWGMRTAIQTQDFEKPDEKRHELPELWVENIALLADKIEQIR